MFLVRIMFKVSMSNLCANLFRVSDVVSGEVFGISVLSAILALIVPPVSLFVSAIISGLELGQWGLLFSIAFIVCNYLTYRHKVLSLLGHLVLLILLLIAGNSIPYLYIVLFLIYLMPYVIVYQETKKTT